ncbi:sodium:solute symporter family protein [Desulfallas thermosapovorans]|uniref:SSS family solute:Na+ symporter n=1 Tax=Desulfallas thermosapovorans DSM 6562 TaxID=1121431 RepID=A0A5S4ZV35_9FIRM|nr:sodium:solute symporter family protein [Desulfallas thermosapovorans]TYO96864.1 SSS family solute:Na+ symporter [Desulfallas thermosapovorans DSM 6562]
MHTLPYYTSVVLTLAIVTLVGLHSVGKIKTSQDYIVGGRNLYPAAIAGAIVGSFVGGTVTIGTAQMACKYGLVAIWFTIGAGLSCLLLALFMIKPLREKEVSTITEYLIASYGEGIRFWVALFTVIGMLIQVAVQIIAAIPVLSGMFSVGSVPASFIIVFLIVLYMIGGGIWSTGLVGMVKLALLSITLFAGGVIACLETGGLWKTAALLTVAPTLSLFPRGALVELGGLFSVLVGFASTQAFLQPLFAGRDVRSAKIGALVAAALIPMYGFAGVIIGLFMKVAHPGINPVFALPVFFNLYLSPWLGGVANATLLISLILTGGALTLGVSTVLTRDVYATLHPGVSDKALLRAGRLFTAGTGAVALAMVLFSGGTLILDWTYLSNALRGVTVFLPLLAAVFIPARVRPRGVLRAVILAPVATLLSQFFLPLDIHPLFVGLPVALLCMLHSMLHTARPLS